MEPRCSTWCSTDMIHRPMGSTEAMATDDLLRRPATGPRGPATKTGHGDWLRTQTDYATERGLCCRTTGCSRRRLASAARLTEACTRPPRARCRSHRRPSSSQRYPDMILPGPRAQGKGRSTGQPTPGTATGVAHGDWLGRPATDAGYGDLARRPATEAGLLSNDGMQQTAPRGGRAANGGVDAATACSLSLAPAPLLIPVFYGRGTLANGVTPPTNPWRRISGYGCRATERGSSCSTLSWHSACETALRPAAGVAP